MILRAEIGSGSRLGLVLAISPQPSLHTGFVARGGSANRGAGEVSESSSTYATIQPMKKVTVRLPEDLTKDLARVARQEGVSRAELIRRGIRYVVEQEPAPRPTISLFSSGDPTIAERVDEWLALENRARRASRAKFEAVLAKIPDVEPEERDRLEH